MDALQQENDRLREEIAVLECHTRKLTNQIGALQRAPAVPEEAIRAVWEHGRQHSHHTRYQDVAGEVGAIFADALKKGDG